MEVQFTLFPNMTDDEKIALAVLYLHDDALMWWQKCLLLSTPKESLDTWAKFCVAIKKQLGVLGSSETNNFCG